MQEKFRNTYRIPTNRWQDWDYAAGAYFITICTAGRERWLGKIENGSMHLSPVGETAARFWHEIPNHFPHVRLDAFVVMPDHVHGILVIDDTAIVETLHATSNKNQLYATSNKNPLHATSDNHVTEKPDNNSVHAPSDNNVTEKPDNNPLHATSDNHVTEKPDNNPLHAPSDNSVTEKPDNNPLHAGSDNNTKNISDISNELYDISGSETLHATSLRDNTANILHPKNEQMSMISPKSGSLSQIIRSYKSAVSKQIHLINPAFAWQPRFYDRVIRDWDEFRHIAGYIETNPEKWEEKQHSQTNKQL